MLRINDLKLPLDHNEQQLKSAIAAKLGVDAVATADFSVFKRSYDARKKSDIKLIYQVDITLD